MNTRMHVLDRFDHDPAFRALVDMLTAWLMQHQDYTPTEMREAAMCAAQRVEMMTIRRVYTFDKDGTLLPAREAR